MAAEVSFKLLLTLTNIDVSCSDNGLGRSCYGSHPPYCGYTRQVRTSKGTESTSIRCWRRNHDLPLHRDVRRDVAHDTLALPNRDLPS